MLTRNTSGARWLRHGLLLSAVVAGLALAGCGSSSTGAGSSGNAQSLLNQTFSAGHPVKSGVLTVALNVTPSGSSTLNGPIGLSISGPFQSRGTGKLPASNFTLAISALGHRGELGVLSTGTSGYVTVQGTAYRLPASDFQRLESGFSGVGAGNSGGGLGALGINPQHWLTHPSVVGSDTVGGAETSHIRAGVNVTALLADLNTFLGKAASSAGSTKIPSSIPQASQQKIASAVKDATVDVWTGKSDKILRKVSLNLKVPVTGQISTAAGGATSAAIGFSLQYANVNQPQTVAAPANVHPYSQFAAKLRSLLTSVQGSLGGSGTGSTGSSGSSGSSGTSSKVQKYSACIQAAGQDVAKMQKCASLLNG
ncbi:MAG TPA: hypothetical protein VE571_03185 [Solirubrobacteraceae bacterium]|nr:hypothetical protein [Solirubrobacteraceae bacterium]